MVYFLFFSLLYLLSLILYHFHLQKMLEICANNIHFLLIINEQKYVNNLYISNKSTKKNVRKEIKANCLNISHLLIILKNSLHYMKLPSKTSQIAPN